MRRARKNSASLLLLLWFFAAIAAAASHGAASTSEAELLKHVRYLASDELMGRGIDTAGLDKARDYISAEFRRYGLAPGGPGGVYFQALEVVSGVRAGEPAALRLGEEAPLRIDEEWTPLGLSSSGTAEGEAVFAGYGITAADYGYDDYAGVDVKGKVAIVLRYEPPPKNEHSPFRGSPRFSRHATLHAKAVNAQRHGARAMVLVDLHAKPSAEEELISLTRSIGHEEGDLIAVQVARSAIEGRLAKQGISLGQLKERIDREERPASVAISGLRVSIAVAMEKVSRSAHNVIAVLPGADPRLREEVIVVGAHYDHLGLGGHGSRDSAAEGRIHYGADDNASGTAVLMALAAGMSRLAEKPPRTILFAAFAGEELGLYGSRHFVAHPPVPLSAVKTMINLDMVGRMRDNQVTVSGAGGAKELQALIEETAQSVGITARISPRNTGGSDHTPFRQIGIPALHFHTGLHEDYHRPTDVWEKLNIDGMVKITGLIAAVVQKLAAAPAAPAPAAPLPPAAEA